MIANTFSVNFYVENIRKPGYKPYDISGEKLILVLFTESAYVFEHAAQCNAGNIRCVWWVRTVQQIYHIYIFERGARLLLLRKVGNIEINMAHIDLKVQRYIRSVVLHQRGEAVYSV